MTQKRRAIHIEGEPECGICYRDMCVDPSPLHPIMRYFLDVISSHVSVSNSIHVAVNPPCGTIEINEENMLQV